MAFSDWQMRRLRARLGAYRLNASENGEPRSWRSIAEDILECEATDLWMPEHEEEVPEPVYRDPNEKLDFTKYDPDEVDLATPEGKKRRKIDHNWPIKIDPLRKFVEGERKAQRKKPRNRSGDQLEAIRDFLLHMGYRSQHSLIEPSPAWHAAYSMVEYFQSNPSLTPALNSLATLECDLECVQEGERAILESRLTIHASP